MGEIFLVVVAASCVAAIVMGIRALRRLKDGRDDDPFGPRQ